MLNNVFPDNFLLEIIAYVVRLIKDAVPAESINCAA